MEHQILVFKTDSHLLRVKAPRGHSAKRSTCIKLPSVFKTFALSILEWPLKTGFTVIEL